MIIGHVPVPPRRVCCLHVGRFTSGRDCYRVTLGLYRNRSTGRSLNGTYPFRGGVRIEPQEGRRWCRRSRMFEAMGFQPRRSSVMLVSSAKDRAAKTWRVHIGPAPKPWRTGRLQGKKVRWEARAQVQGAWRQARESGRVQRAIRTSHKHVRVWFPRKGSGRR